MTAQFPDAIVYEGEKLPLLSNPLEVYYGPDNPRPSFVPETTANWRGYVATWEVTEDRLYLKDIAARLPDPDGEITPTGWQVPLTVGLKELFPGDRGPIFAAWYSGQLRIAQGELYEHVHGGYASRYRRELFLTVESGEVVRRKVVRNPGRWRSLTNSVKTTLGHARERGRSGFASLVSRVRFATARPAPAGPNVRYCMSCGWRGHEDFDRCNRCGRARPIVGESNIRCWCGSCGNLTLADKKFCEWCGNERGEESRDEGAVRAELDDE